MEVANENDSHSAALVGRLNSARLKLVGYVDIIADRIIQLIALVALDIERSDSAILRIQQHVCVVYVDRLDCGSNHENAG